MILDVKQLNKIMKLYYFYTLKALWDGQGKIKMYYEMSRVKKHLSGKRLFQKYSLIMSEQFFLKKAASHATLSFLLGIDRCVLKNVHLLLLFFAGDSCLLPLCVLVWNEFSLRRRTFHFAHSIFKTCVQRKKDHFGLLLNTNTHGERSRNVYQIDCNRL